VLFSVSLEFAVVEAVVGEIVVVVVLLLLIVVG